MREKVWKGISLVNKLIYPLLNRKINGSMSLDIINIAACLLVYFALIKISCSVENSIVDNLIKFCNFRGLKMCQNV